MKKLFAIACVFTSLTIYMSTAQVMPEEKRTLRGTVYDSLANKPVQYATVVILAKDSTVLNAGVADLNGKFQLDIKGDLANLKLSISCVGYLPLNRTINQANEDLGVLCLEQSSYEIDYVSVVGLRPIVEIEDDKIIYNVQSDPTAEGSQLVDILRRIPLLSVSGLGDVAVAGSKDFAVFVNGRRSDFYKRNINNIVNSIPASAIKKIEVITDPSVSQSAGGNEGGVLNIVYDRSFSQLFAGSVGSTVNTRGNFGSNLFLLGTMGKFSVSALVDYSNNIISPYSSSENFLNMEDQTQRLTHLSLSDFKRNQKLPASLDFVYEIDTRNILNLTLSYDKHRNGSEIDNLRTDLDADQNEIRKYSGIDILNGKGDSFEASLFYQHQFATPDQTLSVEYKYGNNDSYNDRFSAYRGIVDYENNDKSLESKTHNNQHNVSVDYVNVFNDRHDIEAGVRYTYRSNIIDNTDKIWAGSDPNIYSQFDSKMDYSQQILVAYGEYTFSYKNLTLRGGGKLEATLNRSVTDNGARNVDLKNDFLNIAPRFSISYRINNHRIRASYTQRLYRPAATALDPFINDTDPNGITYGNPDLKTVVSHNFSGMWRFWIPKVEIMALYYGDIYNNNIQSYTMVNDVGKYETTYKNMGHMQEHILHLTFTYAFSQVNRIGVGLYGSYTTIDPRNNTLRNDGFGYGGTINSEFMAWKEGLLFGELTYTSPTLSLQSETKGYLSSSIGLNQKLFKKKLNVILTLTNPLNKVLKIGTNTKGINYYSHHLTKTREIRNIGLRIIYRFGQVKQPRKPARSSVTDDRNSLISPENGKIRKALKEDQQ